MKDIYFVVGTIYTDDYTDVVVNAYAAHSTLEKAQEELQRILKETDMEAKTHNIEYSYELIEDTLRISWMGTGTFECWKIYTREIDKEV